MGRIIRVYLAHDFPIVRCRSSNSSLHLAEEIVVQARCAVILVNDNGNEAIRGQFPSSALSTHRIGSTIGNPPDFRVWIVGVAYLTIRKC